MAKAPKKFHTEATFDVYKLLNEIVSEHHKELVKTQFLILFKHGGWDSKGRRILGKAKVVGEDMRSTFGKDAIIYLNKDAWWVLSDSQKRYLIDHELCHLDITKDKNYDTILAADGRPKLTTVPHDLEDFVAVVKRHGIIMEDVKRLVKVISEANQLTIDDVQESEPPKELHEGIQVTVDADGTVTVEQIDENQMVIDEVMQSVENEQPSNVTNIGTKRQTKKEKEAEAARLAAEKDSEPLPFSDPQPTGTDDDPDDLPL